MDKQLFLDKAKPYLETFASNIYDSKGEETKWERKSWIASDLGRCLAGVYLSRRGEVQPKARPDFVKNVMHEGKMKELEIIIKLLLEDTEIISAQERLYNPELDISGRYDVLYHNKEKDRKVVEEIKTVNSRAFWYRTIKDENGEVAGIKAQPEHILQITFYLHELLKIFPDIYGILRYRSRDDGTEFKVPVFYEENIWESIKKELDTLNKAWHFHHLALR